MRRFAVAVAAIALLTGGAYAQGQGQDNAKNDDKGSKPAAASQQAGGNGNAGRGQGSDGPSMAQSMRGSEGRGSDNRGNTSAMREERGNSNADRGNRGNDRSAERGGERVAKPAAAANRGRENGNRGNDNRTVAIDRRAVDRDRGIVRVRDFASIAPRSLIAGCPPGLAKKRNGCQPPGQARRNDWPIWFDRPDFWGLGWLDDGRYFYDDGYLVRYAPAGGILGYVPLLGGALSVGNAWPDYYEPVALPGYYERYYGLGPYDSYRYANDVIYRVDPDTTAITSIAALLTGDAFAVGQPMPPGYDVYNVPYGYRDRYVDSPNRHYRYSDGYIYQVDPETRLIATAIELLAL